MIKRIKTAIKWLIPITIRHWFGHYDSGHFKMCEGCRDDWQMWREGRK